jgi:hypothetical protein
MLLLLLWSCSSGSSDSTAAAAVVVVVPAAAAVIITRLWLRAGNLRILLRVGNVGAGLLVHACSTLHCYSCSYINTAQQCSIVTKHMQLHAITLSPLLHQMGNICELLRGDSSSTG